MLSKSLENVLNNSFVSAKSNHHKCVTTEHLLLGLLDELVATNILIKCGADMGTLRTQVQECVDSSTQYVLADSDREPEPTRKFQQILQRAVFTVQTSGRKEVSGGHVLAALFNEKESEAVAILRRHNVVEHNVQDLVDNVPSDLRQEHSGLSDVGAGVGVSAGFVEKQYTELTAKYERQNGRIAELEREIENLKSTLADVKRVVEKYLFKK